MEDPVRRISGARREGRPAYRQRQLRRTGRHLERAAVHRRDELRPEVPRLRQADGHTVVGDDAAGGGQRDAVDLFARRPRVHRHRLRRRKERRPVRQLDRRLCPAPLTRNPGNPGSGLRMVAQGCQVGRQSPRSGTAKPPFADLTPGYGFSHTGWTKAPFPAESQTAKRTHALPVASNGIEKCFAPKGPRSVAEMICRSIFVPSPQITSTNDSGNVHSASAAIVRPAPVPSTRYRGIRISPVVTKKPP